MELFVIANYMLNMLLDEKYNQVQTRKYIRDDAQSISSLFNHDPHYVSASALKSLSLL